MIRQIAAIALLGALAACATQSGPPAPIQNAADGFKQFTVDDLNQAISVAQKAQDPEGVQCFTFLRDNLPQLQVTPPNAIGVATVFEMGRTAINQLPPNQNTPLEEACGPMVMNSIGSVTALVNLILAAAKAGPAILPVIP